MPRAPEKKTRREKTVGRKAGSHVFLFSCLFLRGSAAEAQERPKSGRPKSGPRTFHADPKSASSRSQEDPNYLPNIALIFGKCFCHILAGMAAPKAPEESQDRPRPRKRIPRWKREGKSPIISENFRQSPIISDNLRYLR